MSLKRPIALNSKTWFLVYDTGQENLKKQWNYQHPKIITRRNLSYQHPKLIY